MFYQLLCVQHSCSSTQSWGSVLPSIVEMRDRNSWGCPLLFSNRTLGFFVHKGQKSYTPTAFGKLWTTAGVRCMKQSNNLINIGIWPESFIKARTNLCGILRHFRDERVIEQLANKRALLKVFVDTSAKNRS